jgi:hypothetical protein
VLDLDENARKSVMSGDKSVNEILDDLVASEDKWQSRYAEILHAATPDGGQVEFEVPLPVNTAEEESGVENTFEHKRARTIALLESVKGGWPSELLETVKQQIAEDRRITTAIAECRKTYFAHDQRPDLAEPLTTDPSPQSQQ